MRPDDLQEFVAFLEQANDLSRVSRAVDSDLEVAAIVDRHCKSDGGGKALLFENVRGGTLHLAANLFGSINRMTSALGIEDLEALAEKVSVDLSATGKSASVNALLELVADPACKPELIESAVCRSMDATVHGLKKIPALKSWPGDGGRYLTLGQVFTYHPDSQRKNCGMYRMQVVDSHTLLLRCHSGSGGAHHLDAWHRQGRVMPVAVALGGPPALTWAASVPLPDGVDETDFVGYLTGRPLVMTPCADPQLLVPASAEIVIEGCIHPGETMSEGPFGNHTGYYTHPSPAPVLRIHRITMREQAIYPCTVVGPPPMENVYLARATEQLLLPLLQHDHSWVKKLHMPIQGIFHRAAMVAVDDACWLPVDEISEALRSTTLLRGSRLIVLFSAEQILDDFGEIFWKLVNIRECVEKVKVAENGVLVDARTDRNAERLVPDAALLKKIDDFLL